MRILVTGGAGFIGSVTVARLVEGGHDVRVYDNLSTGNRRAVHADAHLIEGDLHDYERLIKALDGVDGIVHFAGRISVAESVEKPALYYQVNVGGTQNLLDAVAAQRNLESFVFSSSAAVYGEPDKTPLDESSPLSALNPYGETKLIVEGLVRSYGARFGFAWSALRYFNAAGAEAGLGEHHEPESHLVPNVVDAALGRRSLTIFGFDYPTADGTCIRDYVHVSDLADAHVAALEKKATGAFNLGGGRGYSNLEVIAAVEAAVGHAIDYERGPRRAGDPAALVASNEKAQAELGWRPSRDLAQMAADTLTWREAHPRGYNSA
ncbi:MAG TPA: UDP-glucose 4-epimerase GalE [Dehalococcoidia bacterium]|nr:UDP-glucose 4-epimerase GalE [Dehalococcoidia bacterium]